MMAKQPSEPTSPLGKVIYVGRLAAEKREDVLLTGVARMRDVQVAIVGVGPEMESLKSMAEQLGMSHRVQWYGYVAWGEQLFAHLRQATALLLCSETEGLPLVLIEAMSQGVPVIATRVGGIPELVEDQVSGLLVDPGNPSQVERAVAKMLDPETRKRLAEGALTAANLHTTERQLGRVLEAIHNLVRMRGRPK
jgi:glycosyltransferase involved in cell wall biosynthesis